MFYLIIALISAVVLFATMKLILQKPNLTLKQFLLACTLVLFLIALVYLVVTGRLNWLVASVAAVLPFLKRLPLLFRMLPFAGLLSRWFRSRKSAGQAQSTPGTSSRAKSSTIQTRFIQMMLHHDSGQMNGEILEGTFRGRYLSSLSLPELMTFRQECQIDSDSLRVLESWMDRSHETWREFAQQGDQQRTQQPGSMNAQEALDILGLQAGASREEIIDAHRKLIQKLHPDRGGSTYLAAKLNEAKDFLLG